MKIIHVFEIALAAFVGAGPLFAQNGVLDLTTLANYASQPIPAYITRNNTPGNNQLTNAGATLGRVLFYDKRLSRDGTIACASCHKQANGFGDSAVASTGVAGTTGRHGMRLVNARFSQEAKFFWDERAATLEAQTSQPIQNHVEMGFSSTSGDPAFADLVTRLSAIPEYRVLFAMVFGSATIDETRVQRALAQFVRSIQSFDSKFDVGRAAAGNNNANFSNFTASENAGKTLFTSGPPQGAGCNICHRLPEADIDPNSLNNGVTTQIGGGTDLTNTRAPSLRDVVGPGGASNGPLMHDGSKATIEAVIDHYNAIPAVNTNLDPRLRPGGNPQRLNLTAQEKIDLAAFLRTLTGSAIYTDPKWSSPFTVAGELTLIILPSSSVTVQPQGNGSAIVSATGASGLAYRLEVSTNLVNWTQVATVTAGANGVVQQTVTLAGTAFYRFTYTPP